MRAYYFLGGVALLVLLVTGFIFLRPQKIDIAIEFVKPNSVFLGKPFPLVVSFSNNSDKIVENAKLLISIPEGMSFVGDPAHIRVREEVVGDFGPGSRTEKTITLIALADTQNFKHVEAKMTYGTSANARYETSSGIDIPIGAPAVVLSLEAPPKILSGETFSVKVKYENTSDEDVPDLRLKIEYPPVFQFGKSTRKPDVGNNMWNLGVLRRGDRGEFTISGSALGQENFYFGFQGTLTAEYEGENYTLNIQSVNVIVNASPLALKVAVNGAQDYVAKIGEALTYQITYKNNASVALENATVKATVSGELYDFQTVQTSGAFNSLTNTFTWNAANAPQLAALQPGAEGSLAFTVKLLSAFPIRRLSDKNFSLKVQAQIESPTVPPETGAQKTLSVATQETKVAGQVKLGASGYWRDAASGILNAGPYPPRVNQPTQYTIHWKITNYSTDLTDVTVRAFLQSGTTFTGKVKSNVEGQMPAYNPASGEVLWRIPNLAAGKGVINDAAEAIFQVENTPAVNKVGQEVVLVGDATLQAVDTFTGQTLRDTARSITTSLPDDPTITTQTDRRVQP